MTRILLVGQNSFLGQAFAASFPVTAIRHDDAAMEDKISGHEAVLNCAFHPALRQGQYHFAYNLDARLAKLCADQNKKLIMLSSRAVYGSSADRPFSESSPLLAQTIYGQNKILVEASCQEIMQKNLLILRLSNSFGFEWPDTGRATFMAQALKTLKAEQRLRFDMAGASEKDFLPVAAAVSLIHRVIEGQAEGIFNLAAGTSLALEKVAAALQKGYGNSSVAFTSDRVDSFYMDVSKLRQAGGAPPAAAEILAAFRAIGARLAAA